jgi:hypothetical protein
MTTTLAAMPTLSRSRKAVAEDCLAWAARHRDRLPVNDVAVPWLTENWPQTGGRPRGGRR